MTIAIPGIESSFHDLAVRALFPERPVNLLFRSSFDAVTQAITEGNADFGVLAIENSIAGSILTNYNLIESGAFEIYDEVFLNIQMFLMALPSAELSDITEVHSHPVALLQCRDYLRCFERPLKVIEGRDTATEAQRIVMEQLNGVAAIAGEEVAERYGLKILDQHIQDIKNNQTRFVLIGPSGLSTQKELNKASIKFQLGHEIGSLSKALSVLSDHDINLTKIQSLPVLGASWRYAFFVDVTFKNVLDFEKAIEALKPHLKNFKQLGVYATNHKNTPSRLIHDSNDTYQH
ncbi:MAG: prephenate dehydratase [Flavobacteriaceae bacterium]|nr:prephenate dehydratase [Flavobacteriaceae bacterium]MDG1962168.1 prephenate dehydratase [Flavobacteriaceae bacterium]